MRLLLLGKPVSHSSSPAMHNAALQAAGLADWRYEATSIEPDRLADAVALVRSEGVAGANVTVPYKEAIVPWLDGLTPVAHVIGAVNTLVKKEGRLIGHNTDSAGLLADLHAHDVPLAQRTVLILGAGGAARSAVAACASFGAKIRVAARRHEQAEALKAIAPVEIEVFGWTPAELRHAGEDCVAMINATPLGMTPHADLSPWPDGTPFPADVFVYDLVYNPAETRLTRQARAAGLRAATGLGMLVEQGALAFELWTGQTAPRFLMRQAAENALSHKDTVA